MENFLNRYRSITVLGLVIVAQLVLLGVQVKNDQDVRVIRLWTVTAVTPVARILEGARSGSSGFLRNYILMHQANQDNRRLQSEVERLRVENIFLKNELNLADRAKALQAFRERTPSKSLAASVIGTGAGSTSRIIFVDRGSVSGVQRGMPVVTAEGIVGKVTAAYPTASEVLLITDPEFAAGAVSQKTNARGTIKGQGTPMCKLDYLPGDEKISPGDWLYTTGDDRIFPRGFPVGVVKSVHPGQPFQEVYVEPSALQHNLEDVLILVEGVHQSIPTVPLENQPVYMAAPPPPDTRAGSSPAPDASSSGGTEADKLRTQYKAIGDAQGHKFGEGLPGSKPPDFNMKVPGVNAPAAPAGAGLPAQQNQPAPGRGTAAPAAPPAGANPAQTRPPAAQPQQNQPAPGRESAPAAAGPPAGGAPAVPRAQNPAGQSNSPAPGRASSPTPSAAPGSVNVPTRPAQPAPGRGTAAAPTATPGR